MNGAATTGFFTLAGSGVAGGFAYLQGHASRQTARLKELADSRAYHRTERKEAFIQVLAAMTRAQDSFVKLQADREWSRLPVDQRLIPVREIRHFVQGAVFAAMLVVDRQDTMEVLAHVNQQAFETGDAIAEDPTTAPEILDVGSVLLALNHDLNGGAQD
jgi:hypothetical protein